MNNNSIIIDSVRQLATAVNCEQLPLTTTAITYYYRSYIMGNVLSCLFRFKSYTNRHLSDYWLLHSKIDCLQANCWLGRGETS